MRSRAWFARDKSLDAMAAKCFQGLFAAQKVLLLDACIHIPEQPSISYIVSAETPAAAGHVDVRDDIDRAMPVNHPKPQGLDVIS